MTMQVSTSVNPVCDQLWTIKECAAYLRRSRRWLWSALTFRPEQLGSIPHVRIGASPRFFPEDIAAWVRAGCPPAATFAEWSAAEQKRQKRAG
jgi:hypothetical protein